MQLEQLDGSTLFCGLMACSRTAYVSINDRSKEGYSKSRVLILCRECTSALFGLLAVEVLDDPR